MGESRLAGSEEDGRAIGSNEDRRPYGGKRNQPRHCYSVYWVNQQIRSPLPRGLTSERAGTLTRGGQIMRGNCPRTSPPTYLYALDVRTVRALLLSVQTTPSHQHVEWTKSRKDRNTNAVLVISHRRDCPNFAWKSGLSNATSATVRHYCLRETGVVDWVGLTWSRGATS